MENQKQFVEDLIKFREYTSSQEWKALRQKRLEKDEFKCVLCKSQSNLICHHLTYSRLFKEKIDDLIILCGRCHSRIHWISPPLKQPEFVNKNAIDILRLSYVDLEDLREMIEQEDD